MGVRGNLVQAYPELLSEVKPNSEWKTVIYDYFHDIMVSSSLLLLAKKNRAGPPFKLVPFLGKAFLARIAADVMFYLVHRWLHTPWAYKHLHSRHHEHTTPRVWSNMHFEALDLFLGKWNCLAPWKSKSSHVRLTILVNNYRGRNAGVDLTDFLPRNRDLQFGGSRCPCIETLSHD